MTTFARFCGRWTVADMDIRKETCVIIRKNKQFLQGKEWITGRPLWSPYTYDAWRTRDMKQAEDVAKKVGGIMVLFNPVARQMKVLGA